MKCECTPVLLYGLEVCPLTKAELHSLDFAVTRFLMKLFKTSSIAVTKDCCNCFGFKLPSELLEIRFKKFMLKRIASDHVRGYFMTHCALCVSVFRLIYFCVCMFYQCVGE